MNDGDDAPPGDDGPLGGLAGVGDWVDVCIDLLGADGAAVIVTSPENSDARSLVHATCASATAVADVLYVHGCGPDRAAIDDNAVCTITSGDPLDRLRWPALVEQLSSLGVGWVQVYPIGSGDRASGTMQMHRRTPPTRRWPGEVDVFVSKLARVLGDDLVGHVGIDGLMRHHVDLQSANIAIGMLMARHDLAADEASALLRARDYALSISSVEVARWVIDGGDVTAGTV
ncbi:ANTAR domain-containing protein [Rhodococcus sp. BP-316]|uniref:ANTAR domain-containing protein n=1 Tax=Rhodococcus sp. BP-316 TaxID=2739445 RepID=UPI001C9B05B0|nr:ANTAR domain-containing protein [Rhodococcus sp. BP-316]MBY6683003.1 ANTAR domain-containing protein [Rhodococcus sp. BP-316]